MELSTIVLIWAGVSSIIFGIIIATIIHLYRKNNVTHFEMMKIRARVNTLVERGEHARTKNKE